MGEGFGLPQGPAAGVPARRVPARRRFAGQRPGVHAAAAPRPEQRRAGHPEPADQRAGRAEPELSAAICSRDQRVAEGGMDRRRTRACKASVVVPYEDAAASVKEIELRAGDPNFAQVLLLAAPPNRWGSGATGRSTRPRPRRTCRSASTRSAMAAGRTPPAAGAVLLHRGDGRPRAGAAGAADRA